MAGLDVRGSGVGGRLIACILGRRGCGLGRLCRVAEVVGLGVGEVDVASRIFFGSNVSKCELRMVLV